LKGIVGPVRNPAASLTPLGSPTAAQPDRSLCHDRTADEVSLDQIELEVTPT